MSTRRIGVLTSGGDCPGLNAVLRGIVRAAATRNWQVIGFKNGFEGLLDPACHTTLDRASTAGIMHLGGTILGTSSKGHFIRRAKGGGAREIPPNVLDTASNTLRGLDIDGLVAIGGDGSLTSAHQLFKAGFPIVGVPKTIDNDLDATQMTFGFDSAVACVSDSLDRLHTTATSHERVMVVEVMGRHAGWIALYGGLAGGGDVILIPEIPFSIDRVADEIKRRDAQGCRSHMIVVAEGAKPQRGRKSVQATGSGEYRFGGIADYVAKELGRRVNKETRSCLLGHLQRGGAPTTDDRILGTRFGVHAVELIANENFGTMVSYRNDKVADVPLAKAVHRLRRVSPDCQMVQTARSIGISFGD